MSEPGTTIAVPADMLLAWTAANEGSEAEARRTREVVEKALPMLEEYALELQRRREERAKATAERLEARSGIVALLTSKTAIAVYGALLAALAGLLGRYSMEPQEVAPVHVGDTDG